MEDAYNPSFAAAGGRLSRRDAIASMGGTAALLWIAGCGPVAAQGSEFTPEMFGARGDGRSDDYAALKRMAEAVTAAGGGTVRFGRRRHYLIDRYVTGRGSAAAGVSHIGFTGCRGLLVDLNGSTIDVKGDFHRPADEPSIRNKHSSFTKALTPLLFTRCTGVTVRDGVLNGNVQRMTRDRGVIESDSHGISMLGCSDVVIERLHIHHFSSDGIRLGITTRGEEEPCRNVRIAQVRVTNNARQGMTIAGGTGIVAIDSVFSDTGTTGGRYGYHGPAAGVDVEPFRDSPPQSDFRAERCRFDNNHGAVVVAGNPHRTAFVELIDCSGRVPAMRRLILSSARGVIRGGSWHNVQIACAYAARRRFTAEISIEVSGGLWEGDDPAWSPVYDMSPRRPRVHIHNNRFRLVPPSPLTATFSFLCANPNHRFEENEVFVSRAGHDGESDDFVGQFRGAALLRGNRWSTDARSPLRFVNNYQGVQRVEGEVFSGSFAGLSRG